jgi:hypothetical protein
MTHDKNHILFVLLRHRRLAAPFCGIKYDGGCMGVVMWIPLKFRLKVRRRKAGVEKVRRQFKEAIPPREMGKDRAESVEII